MHPGHLGSNMLSDRPPLEPGTHRSADRLTPHPPRALPVLYLFGRELPAALGTRSFLALYFGGALTASSAWLVQQQSLLARSKYQHALPHSLAGREWPRQRCHPVLVPARAAPHPPALLRAADAGRHARRALPRQRRLRHAAGAAVLEDRAQRAPGRRAVRCGVGRTTIGLSVPAEAPSDGPRCSTVMGVRSVAISFSHSRMCAMEEGLSGKP
eukprot:scaffold21387_cov59-Phaeocystis_antarctica.AAC.1